jgi:hypothetical protein
MKEQNPCPYYKDLSCPYYLLSVRCMERWKDCFIYERTKTLRTSQDNRKPDKDLGDKIT